MAVLVSCSLFSVDEVSAPVSSLPMLCEGLDAIVFGVDLFDTNLVWFVGEGQSQ